MKRIVAFLCCFAGGSMLFFLLSLAGCREEKTTIIYRSVTSVVREGAVNEQGRELLPGGTVAYNRCSVWLQLNTTELLGLKLPSIANKLYARGETFRNMEKLTDIRVITLNDYNTQYPAGSDLSAAVGFLEEGGTLTGKAKMLERLNRNYNVFETDPIRSFSFRPGTPPAAASAQQFAIELRTEQQSVLRDTTITFILQP